MEREKLIAARTQRFPGWSLKRVADHIGISENTLLLIEKGRREPRQSTMVLLSRAYGIQVRDLGFEDDQAVSALILSSPTGNTAMTDTINTSLSQDLTARLMRIVMDTRQIAVVQDRIDLAVHDYEKLIREDLDLIITRRNALRSIVLLPISLCVTGQVLRQTDDVLIQCAAGIAACRHFSAGKELRLASDALSTYSGALHTIVQQSTRCRTTAAALLAQCLMLKGELARHTESNDASVVYLKQSIDYGEMSGDALFEALAWRTLAATYYHMGPRAWVASKKATEEALKRAKLVPKDALSPDIQSFLNAGASVYFAASGAEIQAKQSFHTANTMYGKQNDGPRWGSNSYANVIDSNCLMHYYLGENKEATNDLQTLFAMKDVGVAKLARYHFDVVRVETTRDDQPGDLDLCVSQWKQGVVKAKELQSTQRISEAWETFGLMCAAWPKEQSIKDLKHDLVEE